MGREIKRNDALRGEEVKERKEKEYWELAEKFRRNNN